MTQGDWNRRIERATSLICVYPFSAEGLRFYVRIATFQRSLYADFQRALADSRNISSVAPWQRELNVFVLLPKFSGFLKLIQQIAPPPLSNAASELENAGSASWRRALETFWNNRMGSPASEQYAEGIEARDNAQQLLGWIFLQPYAELLAASEPPDISGGSPFTCPVCGSKPIVGVLRPEGDGAKKSLICMLCAHEWSFRRVYCPSCGEEREPQMAFYTAPEIAHVRVDICDTCHTYVKTIDLTKTGLAVPVVDELAAIPLDLWAREHGYEKLQTNMLGT